MTIRLPAKYAAARQALAAAVRVDEVVKIRNLNLAAAVYAFQAKDQALMEHAIEMRARAERRLSEIEANQPKAKGGEVNGRRSLDGGRKTPSSRPPTLAEQGIDKNLAKRIRRVGKMSEPEFEADVARRVGHAVKALDKQSPEQKKQRRQEREQELAEKTRTAALKLGTALYDVILADPPWRFKVYSRETGLDRAADNHYPTMTTEEIAALKVPAAPNSVLFLWATAPILPDALEVMRAWGFTYKSHCIWVKPKRATGFWFWNRHEILLVGTKGKIPAPAPGDQWESVIATETMGGHSEKPAHFAELIEEMFPNGTRLEMFARKPRLGWTSWGNEV